MYQWFDDSLKDLEKPKIAIERLNYFKQIIEEFKINGNIDSGTKISFLSLLKDLDSFNYSKLRHLNNKQNNNNNKTKSNNIFYSKLVKIKFDLKLCSAKEFSETINKIDNCAIKYIELTNKCTIIIRDPEHLNIRHFMGEIDATIEAKNEKYLYRAELSLKRLADAVHYRLTKQIPSCDTLTGSCSFTNLKVLLQSPPESYATTPNDSIFNTDISTLSNLN